MILHVPVLDARKSGRVLPHFASHASRFTFQMSASAHAAHGRVQIRTARRIYRPPRVRFCTRRSWPCAKADTSSRISPATCPISHTRQAPVCKSGHLPRHIAPHASVSAHADPGRVQKRMRRSLSFSATGQEAAQAGTLSKRHQRCQTMSTPVIHKLGNKTPRRTVHR